MDACFPAEWSALLAAELQQRTATPSGDALKGLDGFGGCKNLTQAFNHAGLVCESFEVKDDPINQNCLCNQGVARWIQQLTRLEKKGLVWMGPPCGSWIWISRNSFGRSRGNVLGDSGKKSMSSNVALQCVAHFYLDEFVCVRA
jgi:hypothetical protein